MGTPLLCWGVLSFFLHVHNFSPNLPPPLTIPWGSPCRKGYLKNFINIYVTYSKLPANYSQVKTKSLTELYFEVNQEIESLSIPQVLPVKVFTALFPSLEPPNRINATSIQ